MITQIDFDTLNVEAKSFFVEALTEFAQAYMQGREYAQSGEGRPLRSAEDNYNLDNVETTGGVF